MIPFSALPLDVAVVDPANTFVILKTQFQGTKKLSVTSLNSQTSTITPRSSNSYQADQMAYGNYTGSYNVSDILPVTGIDASNYTEGVKAEGVVTGVIPPNTRVQIRANPGDLDLPVFDIGYTTTPNQSGDYIDSYVKLDVYTESAYTLVEGNSPNRIIEAYSLPKASSNLYLTTTDSNFSSIGSEDWGICLEFSTGLMFVKNNKNVSQHLTLRINTHKELRT